LGHDQEVTGYSVQEFEALDDTGRRALCVRLGEELARRLAGAADFDAEARAIVEELRAAGHDLWSYDDDGEGYQVWCADWVGRQRPRTLLIIFDRPGVEVVWDRGRSPA
jgi:hypothetical protein